jgi:hypothetical protein
MYLRGIAPRGRRSRLGDLPTGTGFAVGLVNPVAGLALSANDLYVNTLAPSFGCSYLDFFFNPTRWQACETAQGVAQIQTVPANAVSAGYGADVVEAAQDEADEQSSYVASDVANVANFMGAGQLVYDPQNQTALPTWAWVLFGAGGVFLAIELLK